jgi:L-ribulose-5-phosphate 3-epimerase
MNRRKFVKNSVFASALLGTMPSAASTAARRPRSIKKGIMWATIGVGETIADKFGAVRQAGFDGVEPMSHLDREEILRARDATGLEIPSVCGALHWQYPLSDPDPSVRQKGVEALIYSIEDAVVYGADTVLLVPGRVTADVAYNQVWERSVAEIKKAIPVAEAQKVYIAIENVWNSFLLSPLEAVRYIDQFESDYVKFYFDCGNILAFGFPEQWIRILGDRIAKIHIKEYSISKANNEGRGAGFRVDLMEGDVNWPAVMKALDEIGYDDWAITEQGGGDTPEGLADKAERLSRILES